MGKVKGNSISDLNNMLMEQMNRLADAEDVEELNREINRSDAMSSIATQVINNGKLAIEAQKMLIENAGMQDRYKAQLPDFLRECGSDD